LWYLHGMEIRLLARRAVMPLLAAALVAITVSVLQFDELSTSLRQSLDTAFSEDSTFGWRVEVWQRVVGDETERQPFEYVIGQPFGSRYFSARNQGDDEVDIDVSPHNFYVQTFARMGLLGVVALIVVYVLALRSASSVKSVALGPIQMLVVLVLGQLVYALSYSPDYMQAVILGSALASRNRSTVPLLNRKVYSTDTFARRQIVSTGGLLEGRR
jgi:hypothetical protein